ncbi:MAG: hypothetical protein HY314_17000 [Acidobacteria bacterium]|nr:hypothetical protein [Acidobacteriota bacterium]
MKRSLSAMMCLMLVSPTVLGQDPRKPPPNPTTPKTEQTGGFGFGGKAEVERLPNPYIFNAALTVVAQAIPQVIKQQNLVSDEEKSRPRDGVFITKPQVFSRGIAVSRAELARVAQLPAEETRSWASGRFSLEIRMSPVDATSNSVMVNATIEGLAQDALSSKWVKADSRGTLENEFLLALRQYIELQ